MRGSFPEAPEPRTRGWLGPASVAAAVALLTACMVLLRGGESSSGIVAVPQEPASTGLGLSQPTTPPLRPSLTRVTSASRLELDRIGPVQVGMTVEDASVAAGMPVTLVPGSNVVGTGRCAHAVAENGPEGLAFMVLDGRIVRIEVRRGPVATVEGIRRGSTVRDVMDAYSGRIRVEPHTYAARFGGQYLVYEPAGANGLSMLFETDGQRVTTLRSGLTNAVMAPEGCA